MQRKTCSFHLVVAAAGVAAFLAGCGQESQLDSSSQEIINGTNITNAVADNNRLVVVNGGCSGFLLRNDWVLTAQHCVNPQVGVGTTVRRSGAGDTRQSDRVYAFGQHDVALVHLSPGFPDNTMLRSVALYDQATSTLQGRSLECYGQGYNVLPATGAGTWRRAFLTVSSTADEQYAFNPNSSGQIQWKGDSGGPCYWSSGATTYLTGIESGGFYLCAAGVSPCDPAHANQVTKSTQVSISKIRGTIQAIIDYPGVPGVATGTPSLIQSRYGTKGNFEFVTPVLSGGVAHYWRNNDLPTLPVNGPHYFAQNLGTVSAVSLIHSTQGNLELAALTAGGSLYFYSKPTGQPWPTAPVYLGSNLRGVPSVTQGGYGTNGNLELAVPAADGGIAYFWQNNDLSHRPWFYSGKFATSLGTVDGVSLIQAKWRTQWGNMELIARVGQNLYYLTRNRTTGAWSSPIFIGSRAQGNPSLIQSRFGPYGNFELAVPSFDGGLDHYWLSNDPVPYSSGWSSRQRVIGGAGTVTAGALIQTNFGPAPGNLEIFARIGNRVVDTWRESIPYTPTVTQTPGDLRWNGPTPVIRGTP